MEPVRKLIIGTLPSLDPETVNRIVARLEEIGVRGLEDLEDVQVDDLAPTVLLPIPARKLKRAFTVVVNTEKQQLTSNSTHVINESGLMSLSTPDASMIMTTCEASISLPKIQNVNENIDFPSNFEVCICIGEMLKSYQSFAVRDCAKCLKGGKILTAVQRNILIRYISDSLKKANKSPKRSDFNKIADDIVQLYPQLRDEIGGIIIGNGSTSIRNQLENRIAYLNRAGSSKRRNIAACNSPIATDEPVPKKKQLRDGYGCIDFLPVDVPDGENIDSLQAKLQQLKDSHRRKQWNESEVSHLMSDTYILQRHDLVGAKALRVDNLLLQWPFLFVPKYTVQHLQRLLGFSILERLEMNLLTRKDGLLSYFKAISGNVTNLATAINKVDLTEQSLVGLVYLLLAYFKEEETVLFRGYEIIPDSEEISDGDSLPQTPCLLFEGDMFHKATSFRIVVDGIVVSSEIATPLAAFGLLFGMYFLLNISYPSAVGATLEYVQRVLLGINPAAGSKVAKTKGRKIRTGVHEGVLSLIKELALHKELDQ